MRRISWPLLRSTATEGQRQREGFNNCNASTLWLYLLLFYMLLGNVRGRTSHCSRGIYHVKYQTDLEAINDCVNFTGDIVIDSSFGRNNPNAVAGIAVHLPKLVNLNGSFEIINADNIQAVQFDSLAIITQSFTLRNLSGLKAISFTAGSTNFGVVNLSYIPSSDINFYSSNSILDIDQFVAIDVPALSLNAFFSSSNSYIRSISIINHDSADKFEIVSTVGSVYISSPGALTIEGFQRVESRPGLPNGIGPIISVTGLSSLTMSSVIETRGLMITNTSLRTFDARSLEITDNLTVMSNSNLEILELDSLHTVAVNLVIANNSQLQDITGSFGIVSVGDVILEGDFSLLPSKIFNTSDNSAIFGNISYVGNSESNCTAWDDFSNSNHTTWFNMAGGRTTSEGRITCVARESSTSTNNPAPIATGDPSSSTGSGSTAKPTNKTPIIAGSVVGAVALLALITGSIVLYTRRRFRQQAPIPTAPDIEATEKPTELAAREEILVAEMAGDGPQAEMLGDLGQPYELEGQGGQSVPFKTTDEQRRKSSISERNEDEGNSAAANIATAPPMKRKPVPQPRGA